MTSGDRVKVIRGEFAGCDGFVLSRESFLATVRLSHSNGTPLTWPRNERVHLGDLQRVE